MGLLEVLFSLSMIPFFSLLVTIITEFIVYSLFVRKEYLKLLGYSLLINGLTWPLVHLFYGYIGRIRGLLFVEIFAIIIETILISLLFRVKWNKALAISIVANLITLFFGIFFGFL